MSDDALTVSTADLRSAAEAFEAAAEEMRVSDVLRPLLAAGAAVAGTAVADACREAGDSAAAVVAHHAELATRFAQRLDGAADAYDRSEDANTGTVTG